MSILVGPEVLWIAFCLASTWLAGRNVAPAYSLNSTLSLLYWIAPSVAVITSYTLCFALKTPAPSWWVLVRVALAACIGVCISTSAIAEKIDAGSGRSGLGMGVIAAMGVHFLVIACATVAGIGVLSRSGGAQPLWAFLRQAAIALAAITGVVLLISFVYDRQTERLSGEDKARRLSQAHGEKIGAKFPGEWSAGRKNWTNFEISFIRPNSIRLASTVKYSESRRPRDVHRHLEKWNGDVGAAVLKFIGAKRQWRATWDEAAGTLIWYVDIDMRGLSRSQFLKDSGEAARLYIGPISTAGSDTWWLLGEAIDDAVEVERATGSRQRFALKWLETALSHAAMYCERAGFHDRLKSLNELKEDVHVLGGAPGEPAAAATRRLLERVRTVENWKQVKHAESDYAFLLNGSLGYLRLAREYVEHTL